MSILLGIIFFHLLVILRARLTIEERSPYATTFVITVFMVVYVVAMMYKMEPPE